MNDFKSLTPLPDPRTMHAQLQELQTCVSAQGNVIDYLLSELQERQLEVAFLMSLIKVSAPTSKIAGVDGKIPTVSKFAAEVYAMGGRATMLKKLEEHQRQQVEAEAHGKGLSSEQGPSEESSQADGQADSSGPIVGPLTLPRVTH